MDDQTFVASYVAQETQRINERLKAMVARGETPSEADREAVVADIETTLERLKSAVTFLQQAVDENLPEDTIHQGKPS